MLYYALCQLSIYCLSATYSPFITFSAVVKHFSFAASVISSLASGGSWRGFLVLLNTLACFFFMNLAAVCLCVGRGEWGSIQWHSALAMCPGYTVILKSLSPNSGLVSSWASCTDDLLMPCWWKGFSPWHALCTHLPALASISSVYFFQCNTRAECAFFRAPLQQPSFLSPWAISGCTFFSTQLLQWHSIV